MPGEKKRCDLNPGQFTLSDCRICGERISDSTKAWIEHYIKKHKYKCV